MKYAIKEKEYTNMVWGVDGGEISNDKLKKLGLKCWGGGNHKDGGLSYHVYDKDDNRYELSQDEYNNIEEWYRKFKNDIRKDKINKIENGRES